MDKTNLIYKSISIMLICMILITSILSVIAPAFRITNNELETKKNKMVNPLLFESVFDEQKLLVSGTVVPMENNYVSEPESEKETTTVVIEEETTEITTEEPITETVTEEPTTQEVVTEEETTKKPVQYNNEFTEEDIYHLAKIIMAEAEGNSQLCKEYVGQVVVNRYRYGKYGDSIYDVVFANNGKTWQFSPCKPGGRWYRVEPNKACYDAAYAVINAETPITDAWYFEDCKNPDNWHSRTLEKVATINGMRFYRR